MEQLLVRLGSRQEDRVQWLVWSADEQEIIASGELPDASQLATLKERAGQRPAIALVPTCDIAMRWVALPPRASRKVLSAIPFMLEDELAQDVSKQFFAMGPRRGGSDCQPRKNGRLAGLAERSWPVLRQIVT